MIKAVVPVTAIATRRVPARNDPVTAREEVLMTLTFGPSVPLARRGGNRFTATACELFAFRARANGESPTGTVPIGREDCDAWPSASTLPTQIHSKSLI